MRLQQRLKPVAATPPRPKKAVPKSKQRNKRPSIARRLAL
jgi:hypothetical protein